MKPMSKQLFTMAAAGVLAVGGASLSFAADSTPQDGFSALKGVTAERMSQDEMARTEGKSFIQLDAAGAVTASTVFPGLHLVRTAGGGLCVVFDDTAVIHVSAC